MKRALLLAISIGCLFGLISAVSGDERPQIEGEPIIEAGDAWTVTITVPDGDAGDEVPVFLFNGLQTFETTLILGTGGVAVWHIPEGEITQAGESMLIVKFGDEEFRQALQVLPKEPVAVDLITTANRLASYAEGGATIIILPRDDMGNAVANSTDFQLDVLYPNGEQSELPFLYSQGLGWLTFRSHGSPGRVRLTVSDDRYSTILELMQVAGDPHTINLRLIPDCVLNDGRDRISLIAYVRDAQENSVTDGTLVNFFWADGAGSALTIDGQATLSVPAPTVSGLMMVRARSGEVWSNPAFLEIVEETCADE